MERTELLYVYIYIYIYRPNREKAVASLNAVREIILITLLREAEIKKNVETKCESLPRNVWLNKSQYIHHGINKTIRLETKVNMLQRVCMHPRYPSLP